MKELTFSKVVDPAGLYDELVKALPSLEGDLVVGTEEVRGKEVEVREVCLRIELRDSEVTVTVPDDADEGGVTAVVKAHTFDAHHRERGAHTRRVLEILQETDRWAARAVEEGTKMSDPKIAYRQSLRKLLATIKTSTDPLSIEIPDPPA